VLTLTMTWGEWGWIKRDERVVVAANSFFSFLSIIDFNGVVDSVYPSTSMDLCATYPRSLSLHHRLPYHTTCVSLSHESATHNKYSTYTDFTLYLCTIDGLGHFCRGAAQIKKHKHFLESSEGSPSGVRLILLVIKGFKEHEFLTNNSSLNKKLRHTVLNAIMERNMLLCWRKVLSNCVSLDHVSSR